MKLGTLILFFLFTTSITLFSVNLPFCTATDTIKKYDTTYIPIELDIGEYLFKMSYSGTSDTLPVYSIACPQLECIIDSFVDHESNYSYYDTSVYFVLIIEQISKKATNIVMQSGYRLKNDTLFRYSDGLNVIIEHKKVSFITYMQADTLPCFLIPTVKKQIVFDAIIGKYPEEGFEYHIGSDCFPTLWHYNYNADNKSFKSIWKRKMLLDCRDDPAQKGEYYFPTR